MLIVYYFFYQNIQNIIMVIKFSNCTIFFILISTLSTSYLAVPKQCLSLHLRSYVFPWFLWKAYILLLFSSFIYKSKQYLSNSFCLFSFLFWTIFLCSFFLFFKWCEFFLDGIISSTSDSFRFSIISSSKLELLDTRFFYVLYYFYL